MRRYAQVKSGWVHSKKGQSLAELAIFGTVLLFIFTILLRYGMNANYVQNMQMQSFRKGFLRAASNDHSERRRGHLRFDPGWEYERGSPPLPSNHWRSVSYTVLEDKPLISAMGILPSGEHVPVADSVEALCSIDMFAQMEYGEEKDLPRVEYEINGRRYSFTIAGYKEYPEHEYMRQKEDIPDWDGQGISWRWKTVSEAKVGDSVDVDEDGYEELVLAKEGDILKVLDYQEGEIDFSEEIDKIGTKAQGLQRNYDRRLWDNSRFIRREDGAGITTTETLNAREIITRTIRTRAGDYEVKDELATERSTTWYTPH